MKESDVMHYDHDHINDDENLNQVPDWHLYLNKTLFIAGSEKNAGKTSFMNYLLRQVRQRVAPAFLTIGIDGEGRDLVFGSPKPLIRTETNDFLITTDKMVETSDALFEIRQVFPIKTPLGRLVLAKTLRDGYIELVGPETNDQLDMLISYLRYTEGIDTIIIDGAASRITQVASGSEGFCAYVLKVRRNTLKSSLDKLRRLDMMDSIPLLEKAGRQAIFSSDQFGQYNQSGEKVNSHLHYIKGAVTHNKIETLEMGVTDLVLDDFTRVFLDWISLRNLCASHRLHFLRKFQLLSVVVILQDVSEDEFMQQIQDLQIRARVRFNPCLSKPEKRNSPGP
ncbi:MAG: hypothetical protein CVV64_16310 [Candidatus Wallbacteria bacterium HGW-Wallbacteria-1]|uniref:Uncharacterized protein n=1 Tax=Candidatus Wallbacteria bacterium HGW-Wallbacteria-1 TaxID=2013854 RepID=A0A2N1PKW4_9BACT|nr:MAG: hypothetical protein CVV64_16310 [Candidatus Wallbacteria bacterium HGW-Wallbacteria-1]